MIKSIGLKNFRVFEEWQEFELSPFTILTGPNDSGKSALQKVLILLSTGFEKIDGGLCDLDKLLFSKDLLKITGDFDSNVNYDSVSDTFEVSFCFEDDLFGNVRAVIIFSKGTDNLSALATKIIFQNDNRTIISFNRFNAKERSSIEMYKWISYRGSDYSWEVSEDTIDNLIEFIREFIISKREKGEFQQKLLEIDAKIGKGISLSTEEKIIKEELEKNKIGFDDEAIKLSSVDEEGWNIRDYSGKNADIIVIHYKFDKYIDKIFKTFNSPYKEILIHTPLVDLVLGEEEILNGTKNPLLKSLCDMLKDNGILTKDDFIKAYYYFETEVIKFYIHLLTNGIDYTYSIWDNQLEMISSLSFMEFFIENKDSSQIVINKYFEDCDYFKDEIISQILKKYKIAWFDSKHDNLKDLIIEESSKKHLFEKISYLKNLLFHLPKTLSKELYEITEVFRFSLQNSIIKRHFYISDESLVDSPFLNYGLKYINNNKSIEKSRNFINHWIKEFEIADEFMVKPITLDDEMLGVSYYLLNNKKLSPAGDRGRGINQLLFVLFKIAMTSENSSIMLEEPETNLHPALQSKMANMFLAAKHIFGHKFIIETHSEYLIRRFQFQVAQSKIIKKLIEYENKTHEQKIEDKRKLSDLLFAKNATSWEEIKSKAYNCLIDPNDVSVYYLYSPEKIPKNKNQVEKLEIRPDGILKQDFGEGFFDESTRLTMDLLKIQNIN